MEGRSDKSDVPGNQASVRLRRSATTVDVDVDEVHVSDFDEDDRMPSKMTIFVTLTHIFLIGLSFNIIIPTSRQYAESLGASDGFSGLTVGVVGFAAAVTIPIDRYLVKRSYAGCLHFLVAMMQIGGVMYSLAQLAKTMWVMLAARILSGIGGNYYPISQFIAEHVGKNHRSRVLSLFGIARSLGFAMGPIIAAILVYVDFNIGELQVNKETNAGWTVAILSIFQGLLIHWYFPKQGSQMIQGNAQSKRLPEHDSNVPPVPLKERVLYYCVILNTFFQFLISMIVVPAWEVAATKVIQIIFKWSIQTTALLVGGFIATTIPILYVLGKLSYKYEDRKILIASTIVNVCSIALMFEYGKPMVVIPYLIGSFFFVNSASAICNFSIALSSKVASLKHVETVQAYLALVGLISRGLGGIIGDLLRPNFLAVLFISLSVISLVSSLMLYNRLVPSKLM